jgi:hypothetical protein
MKTSYAVKWRESSGHTFLGRLDFGPTALVLEGRDGAADAILRTIEFEELDGFHLAQTSGDRLDGKPTLVVERAGGDVLVTSAVMHAGVLQELVHRLSSLRLVALGPAEESQPSGPSSTSNP